MSPQIRPLVAYKKTNPSLYDLINGLSDTDGLSKKQQENEFYWNYCMLESKLVSSDRSLQEYRSQPAHLFFWKDEYNRNNKTTITEMGRLLLAGWYYDIEEFTIAVCRHIYNGWQRVKDNGGNIDDLIFAEAVKHIRENIVYYYHNEQDMRVYLLKAIFGDEIAPLLPEKPGRLETLELIEKYNAIYIAKRTKEQLFEEREDLEWYVGYLQDILDDCGVPYMIEEEYHAQREAEQNANPEVEKILADIRQYNEECKTVLLKSNLLGNGGGGSV
jgi:hypothetical protein